MAMSYPSATGYYSLWLNGTAVRASLRQDRLGRERRRTSADLLVLADPSLNACLPPPADLVQLPRTAGQQPGHPQGPDQPLDRQVRRTPADIHLVGSPRGLTSPLPPPPARCVAACRSIHPEDP